MKFHVIIKFQTVLAVLYLDQYGLQQSHKSCLPYIEIKRMNVGFIIINLLLLIYYHHHHYRRRRHYERL